MKTFEFPVIVIGASAGGLDVIRDLLSRLPEDLGAAILIVWHMAPTVDGFLPASINKNSRLKTSHAEDGEAIGINRVYFAPPDFHLVIDGRVMRLTRGPKENRFRPAIDPLFRSAAFFGDEKVIGIILSGHLDDGTSGLWTIKHYGGTTIVQDPADAEIPSMPQNAMRNVEVDHVIPGHKIAELLIALCEQLSNRNSPAMQQRDERTRFEIAVAAEGNALESGAMNFGELSPLTCPECHGVLNAYQEGSPKRFRCHTGHAFTAQSLLAGLTVQIEENLYQTLRALEERIFLLNQLGDQFSSLNEPVGAGQYFQQVKQAKEKISLLRTALLEEPLKSPV